MLAIIHSVISSVIISNIFIILVSMCHIITIISLNHYHLLLHGSPVHGLRFIHWVKIDSPL